MLVSPSHSLTAGLAAGDKAQVFPINSGKASPSIPSLRQAQEARTIQLKEVPVGEARPASSGVNASRTPDKDKGKRRDWLPLLIREALGMSDG